MINLFEIASRDESIVYLSTIFGIPDSGSGLSISLLGTMFKTFNSVVLAVAALIIVYTTVVGVMMTAHEGEFMKKWNSLWTPIRMVLGVAALVPLPSGYSGLQMIMMWIVVQGIGAADTLWTSALAYIDVVGSPFAQVTMSGGDATDTMTNLFQGIVCQETASLSDPSDVVSDSTNYYGKFTPAQFDKDTSQTIYKMGPNGNCGVLKFCDLSKACDKTVTSADVTNAIGTSGTTSGGDIIYGGDNVVNNAVNVREIACSACQNQRTVLMDIVNNVFTPLANGYAAADRDYVQFYNAEDGSDIKPPDWSTEYFTKNNLDPVVYKETALNLGMVKIKPIPKKGTENGIKLNPYGTKRDPSKDTVVELYWPYYFQSKVTIQQGETDFIGVAVDNYLAAIADAVNKLIQDKVDNPSGMRQQFKDIQARGWIAAGGYYFALAKQQANNFENAIPDLDFTRSQGNDNKLYSGNYRTNFTAAGWLADLGSGDMDPGSDISSQKALKKMGALTNKALKGVKSSLKPKTSGGKGVDPVVALQATGTAMLIAGQVLYVTASAFWAGMTALANIPSVLVAGSGYAINPAGWFTFTLFVVFMPLVIGLEGFLITFGGMLAVYLPLIPYIIFTFGVIGWFLSVMEAMIAGPIIALGIITPSQHGHELLGKADKALMMIFQIFLRPSLMIFGFIAAMLLANVLVKMVAAGFWQVAASSGVFDSGPMGFILFLAAYITLIVTVINKCFAAIHIIPDKVLHWIGHQGGEHGASDQELSAMKGGISTTSGKAQSGMKGTEKGMQQGKSDREKSGGNITRGPEA